MDDEAGERSSQRQRGIRLASGRDSCILRVACGGYRDQRHGYLRHHQRAVLLAERVGHVPTILLYCDHHRNGPDRGERDDGIVPLLRLDHGCGHELQRTYRGRKLEQSRCDRDGTDGNHDTAMRWWILLLLTGIAVAQGTVDFTNSPGTLSGSGSGLSLTGSTLTSVNGFNGGGLISGTLGSVAFSTGTLASGSLAAGASFNGGGSFVISGNGSNGLPNGAIFTGSFSGPVTWMLITAANGTHSYTMSGYVTGKWYGGQTASGSTVQATVNIGSGFFGSSATLSDGSTNISYGAAQCTPPNYPCTCTSTAVIPPPATAPFSGLTGAGTLVLDPEPISGGNFSNCMHSAMLRLTDANTFSNKSFFADAGESGDRNHFSKTSQYIFASDSGTFGYFWSFNPATMVATFKYNTRSGGVTDLNNNGNFSRVTENLFYAFGNTAGTTDGTVLQSWDVSSVTPPTRVAVYDFASSANGVPAGYMYTTDPPAVSSTDQTFAEGFSTSGSQGTARIAAAWTVGSGISVYNTLTGAVTGDYGSTGTIQCQNCTGGVTNPGTFTIHNIGLIGEQWVIIQVQACDGGSTCYNNASPYLWQRGTTSIWACVTGCSGHHIDSGISNFITEYSTPFWSSHSVTSYGSGTSFPASYCSGVTTPFDAHGGWFNNTGADQEPFFISTTSGSSSPSYTFCNVNEILGIYAPSNAARSGSILRFAHTFSLPTSNLAGQEGIISISQDGQFATMTSPMNNGLGSTAGATTCTPAVDCRSDVFVVRLVPPTATTAPLLFGAGFNSSGNPWPPVDGNNLTALVSTCRLWDDGVKWGQFNTGSGTFGYSGLDTWVNNRCTNFVPSMNIIYTMGDTPSWDSQGSNSGACANPDTNHSCTAPSDLNNDGTGTDSGYISAEAAIFNRYGSQITYWEIWNEADSPNFWCWNGAQCGGGTNPALSANVASLKNMVLMGWDAKQIAHCLSPSTKILSPSFHVATALTWFHNYNITSISAPARTGGSGGVPVGCSWGAQTVTGAMTYDYVNVHARGTGAASPDPAGNWNPAAIITAYNNTVTEIANDNLPNPTVIFNDEFGYTNSTDGGGNTNAYSAYVAQSYVLCASLSFTFCGWYQWDTATIGLSQTAQGATYDVVEQWLAGATMTSPCTLTGSIYQCSLTNAGKNYLIAWDTAQTCTPSCTTANHSFGSQYTSYIDVTGTSHAITGNGTVALGWQPVIMQAVPNTPAPMFAMDYSLFSL